MSLPDRDPAPWATRFVRFATRRGALLWAAVLALAIPAAIRTASLYLHLKTDIEELLPREAASVVAIQELRQRLEGIQHLGVMVDTGTAENLPAAERMLDDLATRVRAYPKTLVRSVRTGNDVERAFLEKHAPLYLDEGDLETIRARVQARKEYEVAKATGTLLDDDPPPPLDFSDLEAKYRERLGGDGERSTSGRYSSAARHETLLLIEVGEFSTGGASADLLGRVQQDLAALGGADRYAPGMRVGFTGDVAISVEETSALMADLSISSAIVLVAVLAVLVFYYRWARSVLLLMPPLLLGTFLTFGAASLPPFRVTELNSNTAFLGSIIVGNGINFGIILVARYVEERRRGVPVERAMALAVEGARPGTIAAALAASAAYASLAITDFRGFRQFGFIGGLGMLICWVLAFLLTPSLAARVDRGDASPKPVSARGSLMAPLARLVSRRPWAFVAVSSALTLVAALEVRTFSADQIEYDLSKLRRADTWTSGEGYWGRRMDELLGAYLTPTVLLADDAPGARELASAVREAAKTAPLAPLVGSVRTLDDVLPSNQPAKLAKIRAIKAAMTAKVRSLVPADKREAVEKLLAVDDAHEVTLADLPPTFTLGMRERDGSIGRTVLVFPKPSSALWVGPPVATFASSLRAIAAGASPARPARVAGSLLLTADIFSSLRRDGPLATGLAFASVALVVLGIFRQSAVTLVVLGSLCVGVLWLAALAMSVGVRINFTNFIAYPITFGIGVDYAVNVMSRHVQAGRRDVAEALRSTGGAVALCSATTVIGYSSLLVAENRALFLFGLLAVLGEITCLATALVAMPAFLALAERRRAADVAPEAG
jgi:hypothetical protein